MSCETLMGGIGEDESFGLGRNPCTQGSCQTSIEAPSPMV